MHNGNRNIEWIIMPKKEGSDRNVRGTDGIGNRYEGVAIIKDGQIEYIQDAWCTSMHDQSGNGNHVETGELNTEQTYGK